jgi:hypothetical protein
MTAVSTVVNGIRDTVSSVFNAVKNTVTTVWNGIKSAIITPIEAARDAVKNAIDEMKGFFNFEWKLPDIKLPHFSIEGEFSLNPPSVPHLAVDWYDRGGIFSSPTVIGVGEKRPEFVGALDDLRAIVREETCRRKLGGSESDRRIAYPDRGQPARHNRQSDDQRRGHELRRAAETGR